MEYLKNRVKELKNHNDQLMEMNELLKEELVSSEQINKAMIGEFLATFSAVIENVVFTMMESIFVPTYVF